MDEVASEVDDDPRGVWPEHVIYLSAHVRAADAGRRSEDLAALWRLLNLALQKYARFHARRLGRLSAEEVRDIASDKASDLIARIDSTEWDPAVLSPDRVRSFLATVARNGVVDALRTGRREVPAGDTIELRVNEAAGSVSREQEDAVGRNEVAGALADCAAALTPRSRKAWLLRVFYEFSSAEIARHPAVTSSPAGVDAMLARCREHLQSCMEKKGVAMRGMPTGTFVRLWELTERDRSTLGPENA